MLTSESALQGSELYGFPGSAPVFQATREGCLICPEGVGAGQALT
jgi:hypothetical protein